MVGRSGVSKGCIRCRQRKKGCDSKRPSCGQCQQRGVTCPGYPPGLKFIHDTRNVGSSGQASIPSKDNALSPTQTPPSCLQSAVQAGLADHFWYLYLPRKQASPGSTHGSLHEFFQAADQLTEHEGIGKHAFWALSSLIIGREVDDSRLLLEGTKEYGLALREMQTALKAPRSRSFDQLAMVCNLLALYELFGDPSGTGFGFFTHSRGLSGLMQLCGPRRFRSGTAASVFPGVRGAVIFSAIQRREATFLSSEAWCTVPWEIHEKAQWHKAFDILAQLPGLLERYDTIERDAAEEAQSINNRRCELLHDCWHLDQVLQSWYNESSSTFGFRHPGELWYTQNSTRNSSPFALELDFADQIHALAIALYWATSVILYTSMGQLHEALRDENAASLSRWPNPSHAASLIIQSIAYYRQPYVGILMRKIFLFPLAAAYAHFASVSTMSSATQLADSGTESHDVASFLTNTTAERQHSKKVQAYITESAMAMNMHGARLDALCRKFP